MRKSNNNGVLVVILLLLFAPIGLLILGSGLGLVIFFLVSLIVIVVKILSSIIDEKEHKRRVIENENEREQEKFKQKEREFAELRVLEQKKLKESNERELKIKNIKRSNVKINERIDYLLQQMDIIKKQNIEESNKNIKKDIISIMELNYLTKTMLKYNFRDSSPEDFNDYCNQDFDLWLSFRNEINSNIFLDVEPYLLFYHNLIYLRSNYCELKKESSIANVTLAEFLSFSKSLSKNSVLNFRKLGYVDSTVVYNFLENEISDELNKLSVEFFLNSDYIDYVTTNTQKILKDVVNGKVCLDFAEEKLDREGLKELRIQREAVKNTISWYVIDEISKYTNIKYKVRFEENHLEEYSLYHSEYVGEKYDSFIEKCYYDLINEDYSEFIDKVNFSYIEKWKDEYSFGDDRYIYFSSSASIESIDYGINKLREFQETNVETITDRIESKRGNIVSTIYSFGIKEFKSHSTFDILYDDGSLTLENIFKYY